MKVYDEFSRFHPLNNFLYFAVVFVITMSFLHPVCQIISLITAVLYYNVLSGQKQFFGLLKLLIPVFVFTAILSPLFSHAGMTIITYLPSGNPLTLESILYGINSGIMFCSVIIWFSCFSRIITTDKYVYLFGKILPVFSLLLSLTLRFIPLIKQNFDEVSDAQDALVGKSRQKGIVSGTKRAVRRFSIVLTSCLEHSADIAASMKCRGYGTKSRTAYSVYKFEGRDKRMLYFILAFVLYSVCIAMSHKVFWRYYPDVKGVILEPVTIVYHLLLLIFLITPVIVDKKGDVK